MQQQPSTDADWFATLARKSQRLAPMLRPLLDGRPRSDLPHGHTLAEIAQQPETWIVTARMLLEQKDALSAFLARARRAPAAPDHLGLDGSAAMVFSGSGSSAYAGGVAASAVRRGLGVQTLAIPDGDLLTSAAESLPPVTNLLHVSLARSGNSPESVAAVDRLLTLAPQAHHLIITCNPAGTLARCHADDPRFHRLLLDARTNDRSLVMTSSFTNLALAGMFLGTLGGEPARRAAEFSAQAQRVAEAARRLLAEKTDGIAQGLSALHTHGYRRAVFLGTGAHLWAAREAALKTVEITAGRVLTFAETFLGLRHGPMSAIDGETLVVAFVSSDPTTRAYERDLLLELARKKLGGAIVVAGEELSGLAPEGAIAVDYGTVGADEGALALLDAVVGQLLGLFECTNLGLAPDAPSPSGVIERVVPTFAIH